MTITEPTRPNDAAAPSACEHLLSQLDQGLDSGEVPVAIFGNEEIHRRELRKVFGRCWVFLAHESEIPAKGDTVVTWGSSKGAPYVAGVPVGVVDSVYSSVRDSTQHARITPMVDFTSLDVVGVAVPSGTTSDRAVIDADGRLK